MRQGRATASAAGLDRALGDVEHRGSFGDRQAVHVDQDERQALTLGQGSERAAHVEPGDRARVLVALLGQVVIVGEQ